MNPASSLPFCREETYHCYLDGLLSNRREQCRASFEQWLANLGKLETWIQAHAYSTHPV